MMNQPYLSQLLLLSSQLVIVEKLNQMLAFERALESLFPAELSQLLLVNRALFLEQGDAGLSDDIKQALLTELAAIFHPAANEIVDWIKGKYLVGPECLTD